MKTEKSKKDLEIKVDGKTLKIVSKYVYLGSTISGDGDGMEEIRKGLAMAMHKLIKMKFLWRGQDAQKTKNSQSLNFPHSYISL